MMENRSKILTVIVTGCVLLLVLMVLFINNGLASLGELFAPGCALWVNLILLAIEAAAFLWFWRGLFGRHRHLLLVDGQSPEEHEKFRTELTARLQKNPHIIAEALDPQTDDYLEQSLFILGLKADAEIRKNAQRIFLATALSQNGRLDALIVFVALCRMVWRVSGIYNQRPHPREVINLYWAVVSTTFLAFSVEELDIATEISVGFGESFQATAPAGLTASIPFAGKALQTFTASVIDGSVNCYLALRVGIITRNAYAYGACTAGHPGRVAVFKEAGAVLLSMSSELMERLAKTLAAKFVDMAKLAQGRTVQAGKDIADGLQRAGGSISDSAGKLASGTANVVQHTGSGLKKAGANAGSALASGAATVASGVAQGAAHGAGKAIDGAGKALNGAGKAISATGKAVGEAGKTVGEAGGKALSEGGQLIGKSARIVARPVRKAAGKVAGKITKKLTDKGKKAKHNRKKDAKNSEPATETMQE